MAQMSTETESRTTAEQAKEQVKQQAQQAGGQARERLREQVDRRSTEAGERVGTAARDARSVAQELRKQGKDQPARLVEQAADRIDRAGGYLKESDGARILRDVEELGRSNPWTVVAGGLAVGFAASRFLKASSSRRYRQLRDEPSPAANRGPLPSPPAATGTAPSDPATPPARGSAAGASV